MKYINNIIKGRKYFLPLIFLISFACNESNNEQLHPFDKGNSFSYRVEVSSADKIILHDTLHLNIEGKDLIGAIFGGGITGIWSSSQNPGYSEKREIDISNEGVTIQMPVTLDYFERENIAIAPYPTHSNILKTGYTVSVEKKFSNGYGKLRGKTIKQLSTVLDSSNCYFNNETYSCKVIEGKNVSRIEQLGEYSIRTYFHKDYGFIKIVYNYPNDKIITFDLISYKSGS